MGLKAAGTDPFVPERSEHTPELSEQEKKMLAFENQGWRHAGAKEEAIHTEFGLSTARYYQLLNAVIDSPAAIVHDPMLVGRLQRLRRSRVKSWSR